MTASLPEDTQGRYVKAIPAGRFAHADEVAAAVRFLAVGRRGVHQRSRAAGRRRPGHGSLKGHWRELMGLLDGKTAAGHRRAHRRLDRLPRGAPRAGGGRRRRPHLVRPADEDHDGDRAPAAEAARRWSSSTSRRTTTSAALRRPGPRARRRARRRAALDRVRARGLPFDFLNATGTTSRPPCTSRRTRSRRSRVAALPLLQRGRLDRRPDFDAPVRLAGVRLDGRGQGGVRVDRPLPGPRARPGRASG